MDAPLILTLRLEAETQLFFDNLRKEYSPKHINYLEAHCTLFHKLPSSETYIQKKLREISKRPAFLMKIDAVKNIGTGVVYTIDSRELLALYESLQQSFSQWLTGQDRQPLKPHITIQNKVTAFKALTLCKKLQVDFKTFDDKANGISSFLYLKGPWKHLEDFDFE